MSDRGPGIWSMRQMMDHLKTLKGNTKRIQIHWDHMSDEEEVWAIRVLVEDGLSPVEVFELLPKGMSDFPRAVRCLADLYESDQEEFLVALVHDHVRRCKLNSEGVDNVGSKYIFSLLLRADNFPRVVRRAQDVLLRGGSLFTSYPADEYWTRKVRYYLKKCDYRRAWDELLRSYHGISPSVDSSKYVRGAYRADQELLRALLKEIYEELVLVNRITRLEEDEYQSSNIPNSLPGYGLAKSFERWTLGWGYSSRLTLKLAQHLA